jgi:hypothetical protein
METGDLVEFFLVPRLDHIGGSRFSVVSGLPPVGIRSFSTMRNIKRIAGGGPVLRVSAVPVTFTGKQAVFKYRFFPCLLVVDTDRLGTPVGFGFAIGSRLALTSVLMTVR